MPTNKTRLFHQWRGDELAKQEKKYTDTVDRISDYVEKVKGLNEIKEELNGPASKQYISFEDFGKRTMGTLLFGALVFQEELEALPETVTPQRTLYTELNTILWSLYLDGKSKAAKNLQDLFAKLDELLELSNHDFLDKKRANALCKSLYTMLRIFQISLGSLGWTLERMASVVTNVDGIRAKISPLIKKIELRVAGFALPAEVAVPVIEQSLIAEKTIQEHLNERYVKSLKTKGTHKKKLQCLDANIDGVTQGITRLITAKNKEKHHIPKMKKFLALLRVLEANEEKVGGRAYFLEIMESHRDTFNLLMRHTQGVKKEQLLVHIAQLKHPSVPQRITASTLYGLSQVIAAPVRVYRRNTPKPFQHAVAAIIPSTLDSKCKLALNSLLKECLTKLHHQVNKSRQVVKTVANELAGRDAGLKKLLMNQSIDELQTVVKANHKLQETVAEYRRISVVLKEKMVFLGTVRDAHRNLTEFVRVHDDLCVWFSNFFAQFFSCFKSDTALLIDKANEMKSMMLSFEMQYQREISDELVVIKTDPNLDEAIKDELMAQFNFDTLPEVKRQARAFASKTDIRFMIDHFSNLFVAPRHILALSESDERQQVRFLTH